MSKRLNPRLILALIALPTLLSQSCAEKPKEEVLGEITDSGIGATTAT